MSAAATEIPSLDQVTVAIVTALPEEYVAVYRVLELEQPVHGTATHPFVGRIGRLAHRWGGHHVVLTVQLLNTGENPAASMVATLRGACCKLQYVVMTGIAGAMPSANNGSTHVRLGDVVVVGEHGVYQYDRGKQFPGRFVVRSHPRPPSADLVRAHQILVASAEEGVRPWESEISRWQGLLVEQKWQRPSDATDLLRETSDWVYRCFFWRRAGVPESLLEPTAHPEDPERRPGLPRVFAGAIGSANRVLGSTLGRRQLQKDHPYVRAVEMECAGVAEACWQASLGYYSVRGVSDYCNQHKTDGWHHYAALVAACYTKSVLEAMPALSATGRQITGAGQGPTTTVRSVPDVESVGAVKVVVDSLGRQLREETEARVKAEWALKQAQSRSEGSTQVAGLGAAEVPAAPSEDELPSFIEAQAVPVRSGPSVLDLPTDVAQRDVGSLVRDVGDGRDLLGDVALNEIILSHTEKIYSSLEVLEYERAYSYGSKLEPLVTTHRHRLTKEVRSRAYEQLARVAITKARLGGQGERMHYLTQAKHYLNEANE